MQKDESRELETLLLKLHLFASMLLFVTPLIFKLDFFFFLKMPIISFDCKHTSKNHSHAVTSQTMYIQGVVLHMQV